MKDWLLPDISAFVRTFSPILKLGRKEGKDIEIII